MSVIHKRLNLVCIILEHDFVRISSMSLCGSKASQLSSRTALVLKLHDFLCRLVNFCVDKFSEEV
jgi:hypothetical protein